MNRDIEYINKLINKMKTVKEDNNYPEDILSNNDCILLSNYINDLTNKIDKLKEYIETHTAIFKNGNMLVDMNIEELSNILGGNE